MQMAESYNIRARIMIVQAVKMLTLGIVFVLLYSSTSKYKKVYIIPTNIIFSYFVQII